MSRNWVPTSFCEEFDPLMGKNFPKKSRLEGQKTKFKAWQSFGPPFAYTISAFNRILDFSNGLDIYLGFFFVPL
jgi:hypothetical protein